MDELALLEIHEKYFPQIYRYLAFRIGEPELCEAISGQAFVHLVNALRKEPGLIDRSGELLFKIANELANASLRNKKGSQKSTEPKGKSAPTAPSNATKDQFSWLGAIVHQSLRQLSLEQQHILALRFAGGISADEISIICGRGTAEIRESQFEALDLMRRFLEEAS